MREPKKTCNFASVKSFKFLGMKKGLLDFFAFVAMMLTAIAFDGCSGTVGGSGKMTDTESQNDHYRDVVQREPSFWDIDKIIKSEPKEILLYAVDGV